MDEQTIINQSFNFFTNLIELVTFKKESRYTKSDEETAIKVVELVKNGFIIPSKIKNLTTSKFIDVFDKLEKSVDKYASAISEFTGIQLVDDKYYRIREASILSFLILVDSMKTLKIIDKLDNPINRLTLREYLYVYLSQLYLLNAETENVKKLAEKVCRDGCVNLRGEVRGFETIFTPMTLMGLISEINFEMTNEGKDRKHMITGLGLYIINFMKTHRSLQNTLDLVSYRELVFYLNKIFSLHKWVVQNIKELVSEAPTSIYSKYDGDRSYLASFLELDLISFMLSVVYQYEEITKKLKISPKWLVDFPRLELTSVLNRVYLA